MANHVLLNNIDHKNLKVMTERAEKYGDNVMLAMTFPEEFRNIQAHYPIFFHKDANTGQFYAAALFGFAAQENLFLDANGWDASYIPLTVVRHPFLIGIQQFQEDGITRKQRVIHVDMDSPRLSQSEGEDLFMPYGGNSPYLEKMAGVLEAIHHGIENSQGFINALLELELLESFTLDVTLNDGSRSQLQGFYTLNEERLGALSGESLAMLNSRHWLQPIYMIIASHSQLRELIERKNRRL